MNALLKDFLFTKGFFVGEEGPNENAAEVLVSLADLFGIRITSHSELASEDMIRVSSRGLGIHVPEPFYRGFPESVRELSLDELFLDQLVHYATTYGVGDFSRPGHSLFEETLERAYFAEDVEPKDFAILTPDEASLKLQDYVESLLSSTRPLSAEQIALVRNFIKESGYIVESCASKDTASLLIIETRDSSLARLLVLSDVIRLVEWLQFWGYAKRDIKKLNLRNADRKLITAVLDEIFLHGRCNVRDCHEKRKAWNGLLHHIHYKPVNDTAAEFVASIRSGPNLSVYAEFEMLMASGDVLGAAILLRDEKSPAALLRQLNYVLSRCGTDEDVKSVLDAAFTSNKIVLIQLLLQYGSYGRGDLRTFAFQKFNMLRIHQETPEEGKRRRSVLPPETSNYVCNRIREHLADACRGKLGRVYADERMKLVALPLQEGTSTGGIGTLPTGSRIPLPEGKKVRAFTYWELVDDIDLSAIGLTEEGEQVEFSWRTMADRQSDAIVYSGDQTSGYDGGSEFFDVEFDRFRETYPDVRYIVFCDNVFSRKPFCGCLCTAGYMMRDQEDSGEVFEPKTVKSSFQVTCDSTFAYLFGIDLERNEFVWLNIANDSFQQVAGATALGFLIDRMHTTDTINLFDFAHLLATEVVERPEDADVVFCDDVLELNPGQEQIRSVDYERIIGLLNA